MQQVVTLTGVEEKARGTNDYGDWVLRVFTSAGGTKFQTFDDELGLEAVKSIGTAVEIEYEIEPRNLPAKGNQPARTIENNNIKSLKPASEEQLANEVVAQPTEQQKSRSDYQRSKEEVRYTGALQVAATLLASPHWNAEADPISPTTLFELADTIDAKLASV